MSKVVKFPTKLQDQSVFLDVKNDKACVEGLVELKLAVYKGYVCKDVIIVEQGLIEFVFAARGD